MNIALLVSVIGLFAVHSLPLDADARTLVRDRSAYLQPTQTQTQPAPTQSQTQISNTTPAPTGTFVAMVEQEIFRMINEERARAGVATLTKDSKLTSVARAHSADMAKNNYFSHTSQNGCTFSCRINNSGYSWSSIGENIYMMKGYRLSATETARKMVTGWMNSSGHRANILSTKFTTHGVGVAQVGTAIYATDDFARPR